MKHPGKQKPGKRDARDAVVRRRSSEHDRSTSKGVYREHEHEQKPGEDHDIE